MTIYKDFRQEIKTFDELKKVYDLRTINDYDYDFIAENEHVVSVINNGTSGRYPDKIWFTALGEDNGFDFYIERRGD